MNAMINYYSGLSTEPTLADDYKLIMPYTFEDCLNCKNHSKEKLAKNYESLVIKLLKNGFLLLNMLMNYGDKLFRETGERKQLPHLLLMYMNVIDLITEQ